MVKAKDNIKLVPKLRFSGFRGEWESYKLGDITDKIQDGTHFSPKQYESGNFKYITSRNIRNGYMDISDVPYLSDKAHRNIYKRCNVLHNDVLLTKDGASTGNVCLNELEEEFSLLSSVAFIRANKNKATNEYIYQYICCPKGQREIRSTIAGQAITRITLTKLRNFKFHYPTLPEQEKIASFLSAVDKKIQQLTARKELLEQYKKGVMQRIFSQEIRFTDNNGKDYPDWEEKRLGEVGKFYRGFSYDSSNVCDSGLLVIRSSNIQNSVLELQKDLQFVNKACPDKIRLRARDIAICMSNGSKRLVGKSAVYFGDYSGDLTVGAFCSIFRSDFTLSPIIFQTIAFKKYLHILLAGTNINNLKNSDLQLLVFQLPVSKDEVDQITDFFMKIDQKIASVQSQLTQTQTFKKGLLQLLFV